MPFPDRVKSDVLTRAAFVCECERTKCGHTDRCPNVLTIATVHMQRRTPLWAGGSDALENCQALCSACAELAWFAQLSGDS